MGGMCVPSYVISFTQPTPGQQFNGPAASTGTFTVTMLRTDGGIPSHASIPFSISGLTNPMPPSALQVTGTPGQYSASVQMPVANQSYVAIAGWAGQVSDSLVFSVDRTAPNLVLELASQSRAVLRDEIIPVAIHTDKALNMSSIALTLAGATGTPVTQSLTTASVCSLAGLQMGARDHCGLLNFSQPPLAGLGAMFTASVSANDSAGNMGSDTATANVTRIRWRANVGTASTEVRAAPALDSQGNLFIGTQELTNGRLVSLSPTGAPRFSVPNVGAVQSLAVSQTNLAGNGGPGELVYFNSNSLVVGGGAMRAMSTDGGLIPLTGAVDCADSSRRTETAIALYDAGVFSGQVEIGAVTVFNASPGDSLPGMYCSFGARSGAATAAGDTSLIIPKVDTGSVSGTSITSAVNIVFINNNRAFVQRSDRQLDFIGTPINSSGGTGSTFSEGSARPIGMAVSGLGIVGAWTGTTSKYPVTVTDLAGNGFNTNSSSTWNVARPPVILANSVVTATDEVGGSWVFSQAFTGFATLGTASASGAVSPSNSFTSPVVGTGNRVYVVRGDGNLFAFDGSPSTGVAGVGAWSGDLFSPAAAVYAHPTLDCSRNTNGTGLGTLYVVANDGRVTAVIVDSAKLETTAPWPKWQRTAGNSGNVLFGLNPGCP
jgi:hypothetical protein